MRKRCSAERWFHKWDTSTGRRVCVYCKRPHQRDRTAKERLLDMVIVSESGCWLWTGCLDKDGYGKVGVKGTTKWEHAYRASWREFKGEEPPEWPMQLDHVCKVKRCIYVGHLERVTYVENHRRRQRPFCGRGHPMEGSNLYFTKKGYRRCKGCLRELAKA